MKEKTSGEDINWTDRNFDDYAEERKGHDHSFEIEDCADFANDK